MQVLLDTSVLVAATEEEYLHALAAVQDNGWPGAKIYDVLLLACAARSGAERIYTFNGNNFDLKVIQQFHGINLLDRYKSRDLMYDCWRHGLKGGLKVVEQKLDIQRMQPPLDNYEIQRCWSRWKHHGDEEALKTLLKYNEEDVMNLVHLRERLGIQ